MATSRRCGLCHQHLSVVQVLPSLVVPALIQAGVAQFPQAQRGIQRQLGIGKGLAEQVHVDVVSPLVCRGRFVVLLHQAANVTEPHLGMSGLKQKVRIIRLGLAKAFVGGSRFGQQLQTQPLGTSHVLQHAADPRGHHVDQPFRFAQPAQCLLFGQRFLGPRHIRRLTSSIGDHQGGGRHDGGQHQEQSRGHRDLGVPPSPATGLDVPGIRHRGYRLVRQKPLHVLGQFFGGQVTLQPFSGHGLAADGIQSPRDTGIAGSRFGRGGVRGMTHPLLRIAAGVRPQAGQDPIQDCTQTVDVGQHVDLVELSQSLLRGHVGGSPEHLAGQGFHAHTRTRSLDRLLHLRQVTLQFIRRVQDLCQAPVQHHDFAKAAEHHVGRLEIAMDNSPGVSIGDGMADVDKGLQQPLELQFRRFPRTPQLVVRFDRIPQRLAMHEPHRVERIGPFPVACQLVDGHDIGMLQLARNLCLAHETPQGLIGRLLVRANLLQGHAPVQVLVERQPDSTQSALVVNAGQRVMRDLGLAQRNRFRDPHEPRHRLQVRQRLVDFGVRHAMQDIANLRPRHIAQRLSHVALPTADLPLHQPLHFVPIRNADPAPLDQQVGDLALLAAGPHTTNLGKLLDVDEFQLQGQHAEQQVLVGIHR